MAEDKGYLLNSAFKDLQNRLNIELNENEKILVTLWHAMMIIDNGGLRFLFQNDDINYNFLVVCYSKIGMSNLAKLIEEALLFFPRREVPKNLIETNCILDVNEEKLNKMNEIFWNSDKKLINKLYNYYRNNHK